MGLRQLRIHYIEWDHMEVEKAYWVTSLEECIWKYEVVFIVSLGLQIWSNGR